MSIKAAIVGALAALDLCLVVFWTVVLIEAIKQTFGEAIVMLLIIMVAGAVGAVIIEATGRDLGDWE